jgi:hypothetical protein
MSDTALGDWYVNRLVVDRQPLLLLVSAASLLPALVRARSVRALPTQIGDIVARRLTRLGVARSLIEAERRAMAPVLIGATVDRSVLGIMIDFGKSVPYYLDTGWDDAALGVVEDRLAETPCHAAKRADRVVFPSRERLNSWLRNGQANKRLNPTPSGALTRACGSRRGGAILTPRGAGSPRTLARAVRCVVARCEHLG